MNNLSKYVLTGEELETYVDMISSFELQDIHMAIGDETFETLISIIDKLEDSENVILLSTLDKLLSTRRDDLIVYSDEFPTVRYNDNTESKLSTASFIIQSKIADSVIEFKKSYNHLSKYDVASDTLEVLSLINASLSGGVSHSLLSLPSEVAVLLEKVVNQNISIESLLDTYDKIELHFEDDDDIKAFFDNIEDGHISSVSEFVDLLIKKL